MLVDLAGSESLKYVQKVKGTNDQTVQRQACYAIASGCRATTQYFRIEPVHSGRSGFKTQGQLKWSK
eukprot:1170104-Amphidinium_carterae.2